MILKELQNYLLNNHCVSLAEMKQHFGIDGDALRPMLDKLIKKGRVKKLPTAEKCHSCTSCDLDTLEFYEWVDRKNLLINRSPPDEIELYIEDLHCQMCAQTVREALQKVAGVQKIKINLSQKKVTVVYCQAKLLEISSDREIQIQSLMKALEPTGYRAKPILTTKSS
jgi:copper chaperone CopZ